MRVLIFGGNGMLGHKVYQACQERFDVWAAMRHNRRPGLYGEQVVLWGSGQCDEVETINTVAPDVVVNCVGMVKQRRARAAEWYETNGVLPHRLAAACAPGGIRLIHISSDCVFSGQQGDYLEKDCPDPVDIYGWSKLLGELHRARCLTLRTSFIGRELAGGRGLLEWFISQRGRQVPGYVNAVFSGLTTLVLSRLIADVIENHPRMYGVYHVGGNAISKFNLLDCCNKVLGLEVDLVRDDTAAACNRSLNSKRFRKATGWAPPTWPEMVEQLAADATPYDEWRVQ